MARELIALPAARFLARLTSGAPFAVGEIVLLTLAAAVAALLTCALLRRSVRLLRAACAALAVTAAVTALLWLPVAGSRALPDPPRAADAGALGDLCARLSLQAEALSRGLPTNDPPALLAQASRLTDGLPVKAARFPGLFRFFGIAGLYCPLTGETIVNADEPALTLAFCACHESAHRMGYGREDEANYVAYRACMRGDAFFRYAGTMYALKYASQALRTASPAQFLALTEQMGERVQSDFYRLDGYGGAVRPKRLSLMDGVSEAFLRMSGQAGLGSYGLMVDYLLADDSYAGAEGFSFSSK